MGRIVTGVSHHAKHALMDISALKVENLALIMVVLRVVIVLVGSNISAHQALTA